MKVCKEVDNWIKENVEQEVEKQEQRCKDWPWPLSWLCSIVTFIIKIIVVVVRKVTRIVCEVINIVANFAAGIVNAVLSIPILGAAIKAVIRAVVGAVSYLLGLLDGLARLVGIRTTKHLRVHVMPLCEGTIPLAYEQHLAPIIRETERILYDRAQIRMHTTFHEPLRNPPADALRIGTGVDLIADEAWLKGSWHQLNTVKLFESNFSSLVGLGSPIVVYIVREVGYDSRASAKVVGTSGGPFVDWIAVERDSVIPLVAGDARGNAKQPLSPYPPTVADSAKVTPAGNPFYRPGVIAHEICHALGLLGHANSSGTDLMVPGTIIGDHLSPFQVGIVRSSAHVTYL